jgi:DNA (cytosine-5)-methyltransferase 1
MPTITTKDHFALMEPFITRYHGSHGGENDGDNRNHSLNRPIPALDTSNRYALVAPFVLKVNHGGDDNRVSSIDSPLGTITTKGSDAIV